MGYNIERFVVKETCNFRFNRIFTDDDKENACEDFDIVHDANGCVTDISLSGECSGSFWNDEFFAELQRSSGYLRAIIVWECGDRVVEIVVNNGMVKTNVIV